MANTLTNPNLIRVGLATVYTDADGVTVSTTATFLSLFSGVYNKAKNVVISPPKQEVVLEDMLGQTAATDGNTLTFQNYIIDEKPAGMAKTVFTQSFDINEDNFDLMSGGSGTAVVTASYKEYQVGASDSGKKRVVGAVLVVFKHGSGIREILFNNCFVVLGDIKATGSDGHIERDVEVYCAPQDYHDRFKD